jgi:hypothetical protein
VRIKAFQLTIVQNKDTTSYTTKTGMLSNEMEEALRKIKAPSTLFFEGIDAGYKDDPETQGLALLKFKVK